MTGVLGGGNEDVMVSGIEVLTAIGAAVIVPVTVVTPFASGPLIDPIVKVTVGSLKARIGAVPNPVPVIVKGVLSPELRRGGRLVGNTGGASSN